MTIDVNEITDLYKKLLIVQYVDKPKANATIELFIKELLADGIYWSVQDAYDLDTAIGVQLDILGKYVGLTRYYGGIILGDDEYRFLITLKIAKNYTNHSPFEVATSINTFFGSDIKMIDNLDMSMTYFANPNIMSNIIIARNKECLPRPAGVGVNLISINDYFVYGNYLNDPETVSFGFADYNNSNVQGGDFLQYNNIL